MFTSVNDDGSIGGTAPFAEGRIDENGDEYRGRPIAVASLRDGSIPVPDDRDFAMGNINRPYFLLVNLLLHTHLIY